MIFLKDVNDTAEEDELSINSSGSKFGKINLSVLQTDVLSEEDCKSFLPEYFTNCYFTNWANCTVGLLEFACNVNASGQEILDQLVSIQYVVPTQPVSFIFVGHQKINAVIGS